MSDLKKLIDERLWQEVKRNYLSEQYSNAVLDAIQFLGDLIREMSGEDGDGYNLMGRVFNTKNPKIKINKLRTQTEKDVQNGIMFLIQGFYRAIRNERVHEKKEDSKQEAIELILFINYILRVIDDSDGKFTVDRTIKRIFDDNFLPREEYIDHIANEIPASKIYEVAVEVFRNRSQKADPHGLAAVWEKLKAGLNSQELKLINDELSEELRSTNSNSDVESLVFILDKDWINLKIDSRLRAENLLLRNFPNHLAPENEPAPSASNYWKLGKSLQILYKNGQMELEKEFAKKVYSRLNTSPGYTTEYILDHFSSFLLELESLLIFTTLDEIIKKQFQEGHTEFEDFIDQHYPEEKSEPLKELIPDDGVDDLPF